MTSTLTKIISPIGAIPIVSILWDICRLTRLYLVPSSLDKWKHDDSFALVTGATDGLGWSFAEGLAARGFNVILLGRNVEKLGRCQSILQERYPNLSFEKLQFDVLNNPYDEIPELLATVSHLNITLLVNNIGGMPYTPGYRLFTDYSPAKIDQAIQQNCQFMTHFTHHLLPTLSENGPSLVVNIGSAIQQGVPWAAVYSGAKGYVLSFSKALDRECKLTDVPVAVLNINVGEICSAKTPTPPKLLRPRAEDYSEVALNRIGAAISLGMHTVTPYVPHALLFSILGSMPETIQLSMLGNRVAKGRKALEEAHKTH